MVKYGNEAATKAGLAVKRIDIYYKAGKISLVVGKPDEVESQDDLKNLL
jgi:hypothetical protein